MRKIYFYIFHVVICIVCLCIVSGITAQTTLSTTATTTSFWSTNGGALVFGVRNTNPAPIAITNLSSYIPATHNATYTLWYHPTAVTGAPSAITAANGWVEVPVSAAITGTGTAGVVPIFSGLNVQIPPSTTYRLAMVVSTAGPYYGASGSSGDLFTAGGVELYAQANPASPTYTGPFPGPPTTTPRTFYGSITFQFANPCTTPPIPGTAQANVSSACQGRPVQLSLNANSAGTGQTYVWQRAATVDGTYADISTSAAASAFVVNPTVTAFYRAAVTCGSSTTYSTPVQVSVSPAVPGGIFTINSAIATGGTNYQTFTAAMNAIQCGITGPVVFNVVAGSGPYNEQVTIDSISGTSAVNTITINGNGTTLQFAPAVSTDRHLLLLNGTDYVTINNLNITALTGATYGWGIHLTNGANRNTINSCNIDLSAVTSTTQSNSGGIVGAGSATVVTTDGSASENTITNNKIIGAYQGIILNGTTGSLNAVHNIISNNTIQDFYATGIELTDNDGAVISNNDINRRNRAAVTTFEGIELGAGNRKLTVNANRIHDTHTAATAQTGTAYGIYATACDADSGAENRITNNLIYNFNSGSGTIYALYNSSSNGFYYYHNTIVLDNAGSTAGITRGVFQTGAAVNIHVKNNNIFITRGGTGIKYALYFATAPTTAGGIISNTNNLYNASAAGTNGIGYYVSVGFTTLTDWKAASGNIFDQQSVSADPIFTGVPTNYIPTNPAIDTVGVLVGVTNDILNNVRSNVKPDVGAYEFGNNPVPVKLVDFSAFTSKADAIVNWATATELNTHHFDIERSFDGSNFTTVQTVAAKGYSTALTTYTITDFDVWNMGSITKVYYRLKMVDTDGKYIYSRTVTLVNKQSVNVVQVFPNPVENELYVKLILTATTPVAITLTDMAGRKLISNNYTLSAGSNIVSLPGIGRLSSGVYQVQVNAGSKHFNFSILK